MPKDEILLDFVVLPPDRRLIDAVCDRMAHLTRLSGADMARNGPGVGGGSFVVDYIMLRMDMAVCVNHNPGHKLNLAQLLVADVPDFHHDVCAILTLMNRRTGKLPDWLRFRARLPG